MGGSSGGGGTSTVSTQPGQVQIPESWKPYFDAVGEEALANLGRFDLADFAGPNPMNVPGINAYQREAMDQIWNRGVNGIPVPESEQYLSGSLMPWMLDTARTSVGLQPQEYEAMAFARGLPGTYGQSNSGNMRGPQYADSITMGTPNIDIASIMQQYDSQRAPDTETEAYAINQLKQLAGGNYGDSPAMRAAEAKLKEFVNPQVENQMAKMGLGRSGAAASQLQEQQMAEMLPLYQQALMQQESASEKLGEIGNRQSGRYNDQYNRDLAALGLENQSNIAEGQANAGLAGTALNANANLAATRMRTNAELQDNYLNRLFQADENASQRGLTAALQGTLPTYMRVGENAANRQTDWINRQLQTGRDMYNPLLELGSREQHRGDQAINDLLSAGALDRDIAGQQSQAAYNDFMRRQALAELFATGLLGQLPSFSSIPTTSTETTRTSGGK